MNINIMADELLDICDDNNNFSGVQKMKSEAHRKGLWHRAAHIWIYNSKGDVLIQLRAKEKPLYPDVWDISAAGHVGAGEDPIDSGIREIMEEIGLQLSRNDLDFWMIRKTQSVFRDIINNEFCYVFFYRFDGEVDNLKLQKEEVQKIKFVPIAQIEEDLKNSHDEYVPHGEYWSDVLNEMKKKVALC